RLSPRKKSRVTFSWTISLAISYAPSAPPNPALELAGQALGPIISSFTALHVPVPCRFKVTPAGPSTSTWVIGEGSAWLVDPIVALPNALVGTPSLSGEKPASVMRTVSSALAAGAAISSAQPAAALRRIRRREIVTLTLLSDRARCAVPSIHEPSGAKN